MNLRRYTRNIMSGVLVVLLSGMLSAGLGVRVAHAAPLAVTSQYNLAVQYADSNWNYNEFNHTVGPDCQYAYYNCVQEVQAGWNRFQPDFQCAEFVARALAAEELLPGLTPNSPSASYADYWYNGTDYHLGNVGVSGIPGLYDYLVNSGMGRDIGDNPAGSAPGDVLFEYSGTPKGARRVSM